MAKRKQSELYRSKMAASIHELVAGCRSAGVIDEQTMRTFDEECLIAVKPIRPAEQISPHASSRSTSVAR